MKGIKIEMEELGQPLYIYREHDVVGAIAHALYYTANPDTEMCIPNCAFIQAEKMFKEWKDSSREKRAVEILTQQKHLCDTCGNQICLDRDLVKPITKCKGYSKKEETGDA